MEARLSAERSEPRIAVVIPCYDEAPTIEAVVRDFAKALPGATIWVFDNNSRDGTAEIARRAGAEVVHSPVQGKGNVMRHVLRVVEADVYVMVDGDGTYPAEAAPQLLERFLADDLDMLVGTRLEAHAPGAFRGFHRLGNRWISRLISLLFRTELTDVLSGYRLLSRRFLDVVRVRTGGFEIETELTLQALAKGMSVAEVPVRYERRPEGSASKLNTWSDGFLIARCIGLLFKDYKPLAFFTAISLLLALAALASGSAPVIDFVQTGYVLHVPRAILAAGLGILAVVSLTAGLILDTIAKFHAETIELWQRHLRDHRS
jgi:glycosyltransferase involved in cell wall biosynthesis